MAQLNFNAENVDPNISFDPIPAGDYVAHIIESEIKQTKAGNGQYLQFTLEILDSNNKGRRLWDRLNIINPNAVAQEIGQRQLSAVCHATGKLRVVDSSELHNIPMKIRVSVRNSPDYGKQNEVKGYAAANGTDAPSANTAPAETGNRPPWAK